MKPIWILAAKIETDFWLFLVRIKYIIPNQNDDIDIIIFPSE